MEQIGVGEVSDVRRRGKGFIEADERENLRQRVLGDSKRKARGLWESAVDVQGS
jgi:hypothetical protein